MHFNQLKLQEVTAFLKQNNQILAAYLHGSASSNTMRQDSDIDIALLMDPGKNLTSKNLFYFCAEIGFLLNAVIDIAEISTNNLIFAKEVIFTGKRFFVKSKTVADLRICSILGMYYNFKEEQKVVIDAYRT